jgi:hypothetical protein
LGSIEDMLAAAGGRFEDMVSLTISFLDAEDMPVT